MIAAQIELEDGHAGLAELLLRRGIELVGETTAAAAADPASTSSTSTSTSSSSNAELYRMLGTHLLQQHPHRVDEARQVYEQGIHEEQFETANIHIHHPTSIITSTLLSEQHSYLNTVHTTAYYSDSNDAEDKAT